MTSEPIRCSACGRNNFASTRGLKQHQLTNKLCARQLLRAKNSENDGYQTATEGLEFQIIVGLRDRKRYKYDNNPLDKDSANLANKQKDLQLTEHLAPNYQQDGNQTNNYETAYLDNQYEEDDLADQEVNYEEDDDDNFYDSDNNNGVNNYGNAGLVDNELEARRQRINEDFKDYVAFAQQHVCCFTYNQHTALKLMTILRKSKASLDTYDDIMRWHFVSTGTLKEH